MQPSFQNTSETQIHAMIFTRFYSIFWSHILFSYQELAELLGFGSSGSCLYTQDLPFHPFLKGTHFQGSSSTLSRPPSLTLSVPLQFIPLKCPSQTFSAGQPRDFFPTMTGTMRKAQRLPDPAP